MKIITISREFGSGGREIGKRLAEILGYDYYDSEIITQISKNIGIDENYVENVLSNHGWQNIPLTFRGTLTSSIYTTSSKINLLLEQKKVIEQIAKLGKNCVIVGRNADLILKDYNPFNIFVCANTAVKVKRCLERATSEEKVSEKEIIHMMKQIDKNRASSREVMLGSKWGERDAYHLIINTTDWNIKQLTPMLAKFIEAWFEVK